MDKDMTEEYERKLAFCYDRDGKLKQYPSKRPMRVMALDKIADCFETEKRYTEKEVNEIIKQCISFTDVELIRREMYELKYLDRLKDGSAYWKR